VFNPATIPSARLSVRQSRQQLNDCSSERSGNSGVGAEQFRRVFESESGVAWEWMWQIYGFHAIDADDQIADAAVERMNDIDTTREADARLALCSYFCIVWKETPIAAASAGCEIPSSRRRSRIASPSAASSFFGFSANASASSEEPAS